MKNLDDMAAVVTNSTVDGVLTVLFAMLIIVVIADAVRVWVRALRSPVTLPSAEAPFVESNIVTPAGLIRTPAQRRERAGAGRIRTDS